MFVEFKKLNTVSCRLSSGKWILLKVGFRSGNTILLRVVWVHETQYNSVFVELAKLHTTACWLIPENSILLRVGWVRETQHSWELVEFGKFNTAGGCFTSGKSIMSWVVQFGKINTATCWLSSGKSVLLKVGVLLTMYNFTRQVINLQEEL